MSRLVAGALVASAVSAALVLTGVLPTGAAVPLSGVVSAAPVSWTPNVYAGTTTSSVCKLWFGSKGCGGATIDSTAIVNGEVVVAGAFTEACQPGPASSGYCEAGTKVTRDDIFAYQLGTGIIDPNFAPQLNQGPAYSVVAGPNDTVYVGGAFTTVNGASASSVVQLNVTPGDASTDGTVVTAFTGSANKFVEAMALNGNALYIGGEFAKVDGVAEQGVARLNATTGAVDTTFSMPISGVVASGTALKVEAMSLTADGQELAIAGPFLDVAGQSRPRVALIDTGGGVGDTATLEDWAAPILSNECLKQHDYVRAIDFSPDGSFLVIGDTGYRGSPVTSASLCDAAARFPTAATGTDVQPTWVNYAGGDSMYSVQVTGSVVYLGGHNRWLNNECGDNDACEANTVLTMGLSAVDANTGLVIPWFHPMTLRGDGTMSLTAFPAGEYAGSDGGLLIGNDVTESGGAYHSFNALFPLTSTTATPTFGSIPSGLFSQGRIGGYSGSTTGTAAMCVDDTGNSTTAGTDVEFSTCTNAAQQNWTVESNGNIEINGLCLDTAGQATASDTSVVVNTCGSSTTQVWTQGSGNTLINEASGLCLDDPGSSTVQGTVLDIETCSGGENQVWPLPAAPAPASLTPVGPISAQNIESNTQPACITTVSSPALGGAVQLDTCLGTKGQTATIEADGKIKIEGLCLDTAGQATANDTGVILNNCGSSTTQVWTQGSGDTLINEASGLCLQPDGTVATGVQLEIATCTSGSAQKWWLPAV
jgi:hypothetical protein